MHKRQFLALAVLLASATLIVGCGGKPEGPELGTVKGVITVDGKPSSGLTVTFEYANGPAAIGTTDDNGAYTLTAPGGRTGAPVGQATVRIVGRDSSMPEESMKEIAAAQNTTVEALKAKPVVAPQFNSKSELTADVKPGNNEFNFSVTSSKK